MEKCDIDLWQHIKNIIEEKGLIEKRLSVDILRQIAKGLNYMHN